VCHRNAMHSRFQCCTCCMTTALPLQLLQLTHREAQDPLVLRLCGSSCSGAEGSAVRHAGQLSCRKPCCCQRQPASSWHALWGCR
jgi:hypothetical protein